MRFKDFPPSVQAELKSYGKKEMQYLAIDARREADNDRLAELTTDPGEALKSAFDVRRKKLSLEVDDPLDFIEGAIELTRTTLGHEMDEDIVYRSMWDMLTAASDVLREYRNRDREVQECLRAAWLGVRDAEDGA
ncbi:hypothetical protein [Roseovarius indicus]|uniref:Uncharacterized protein n=1 Tax=Roseovarius indicus TaxID=540747 RepID=A0A0T5PCU6_9RHOB|nr:hypothetical protein [Roseovarius indicus]KRS18858.1 hypothetical protein XM52_04005 [Roseovarius indicus]QEW26226.1 hypothetical protein RIdsm_02023 [Roseovarius indicus]SFD95036.1 hypothetical protein SAMN04488031_103436 [Roseovarius indicus]